MSQFKLFNLLCFFFCWQDYKLRNKTRKWDSDLSVYNGFAESIFYDGCIWLPKSLESLIYVTHQCSFFSLKKKLLKEEIHSLLRSSLSHLLCRERSDRLGQRVSAEYPSANKGSAPFVSKPTLIVRTHQKTVNRLRRCVEAQQRPPTGQGAGRIQPVVWVVPILVLGGRTGRFYAQGFENVPG